MTNTNQGDEAAVRADERRKTAASYGACLSCLDGAPEPHGCVDCLNTGYVGGAPPGFVNEKHHKESVEKVRAEEREKVAAWMIAKSLATGHGDTIEDLLNEAEWQIQQQTITADRIDVVIRRDKSMVITTATREKKP